MPGRRGVVFMQRSCCPGTTTECRPCAIVAQGYIPGMALPRAQASHDRRPPEPFERVELLRAGRTWEGQDVPCGSRGTVVEVLGDHEAFVVEFVEPFAALVTVRAGDVRIT